MPGSRNVGERDTGVAGAIFNELFEAVQLKEIIRGEQTNGGEKIGLGLGLGFGSWVSG
jgi:hypothetical protein